MDKKKIVFLTGTRADFGKLKSLLQITASCELFETHIFATGMHMNSKYGKTVDEVVKCGFKNVYQFINHDEVNSMDRTMAKTIDGFSSYVAEIKPDIIVIHGDRIEALAGATVGSLNNIMVIHIEGGELSGTVDDSIRHAVSKLSHVHMVANEQAKKRLIQLGENPETVFIIGSPDLDLMNPKRLPSMKKVVARYEIPFEHFGICMFHPVTTEHRDFPDYARSFFRALIESEKHYILVYPNNDLGSDAIIREIEALSGHQNFRDYRSLRFEYFLRLLKESDFIIGNSSAGIREAPFYHVPTINVGSRQNNRAMASSIINCGYETQDIVKAINALPSGKTRLPEEDRHGFGSGQSDKKFIEIISRPDLLDRSRQKYFQELDF